MVIFDYMIGEIKIKESEKFEGKIIAECNFEADVENKTLAIVKKIMQEEGPDNVLKVLREGPPELDDDEAE